MKWYMLDTEFNFGTFEGKTLQEVIAIRASYINWCMINLDHFCISDEVLDEIKEIKPGFSLSKEADECLTQKNDDWVNEQENYNDRHSYDRNDYQDYERDTFDAITDGQYGDYDDWKERGGDMDHLMEGLGF